MRTNQAKLRIVLFLFSALLIEYKLTTIESAPGDQPQEPRRLTAFDQQILQNASEMIKEGPGMIVDSSEAERWRDQEPGEP